MTCKRIHARDRFRSFSPHAGRSEKANSFSRRAFCAQVLMMAIGEWSEILFAIRKELLQSMILVRLGRRWFFPAFITIMPCK
jgi:hypothetical protein